MHPSSTLYTIVGCKGPVHNPDADTSPKMSVDLRLIHFLLMCMRLKLSLFSGPVFQIVCRQNYSCTYLLLSSADRCNSEWSGNMVGVLYGNNRHQTVRRAVAGEMHNRELLAVPQRARPSFMFMLQQHSTTSGWRKHCRSRIDQFYSTKKQGAALVWSCCYRYSWADKIISRICECE